MHPPRGPRSVLCVVNVTTSEYGTGFGCTPPAIRPAMWAASKRKSAPTSSAISRNGTGSMIRGYAVAPVTISFGRSHGQVADLVEVDAFVGRREAVRDEAKEAAARFTGEPWVRWPPW